MTISTLLAVASGGAVGAVARYGIHRGMTAWHGQDAAWSTLGVNVLGSALLGFVSMWLAGRHGTFPPFVMIGLLGAFTTFSTFALDAVSLFKDRGLTMAGLYVALSVSLSVLGFLGGATVWRVIS